MPRKMGGIAGFLWRHISNASTLDTVLGWLGWKTVVTTLLVTLGTAILAFIRHAPVDLLLVEMLCALVGTLGAIFFLQIFIFQKKEAGDPPSADAFDFSSRKTFQPSQPKSLNQQLASKPQLWHFMGIGKERGGAEKHWYPLVEARKHFPSKDLRDALILNREIEIKAGNEIHRLIAQIGSHPNSSKALVAPETPETVHLHRQLQYQLGLQRSAAHQVESYVVLMNNQILDSLKHGLLHARGFQGEKLVLPIPKEQWDFLNLHDDGNASGKGVAYHTVRISESC